MQPVVFIPDNDIETRMEKELALSCLFPQDEHTAFNIEDFLVDYLDADLDKDAPLPSNRLGEVIFQSNRRPQVKINIDLTVQAESETTLWQVGRWRWTVAHESAHVILHGPLYISRDQGALWEDTEPRIHRCFKHDIGALAADLEPQEFAQKFGWDSGRLLNESPEKRRMEIQANKAAGALLMPRAFFVPLAHTLFDQASINLPTEDARLKWTVSRLAHRFNVSREAARIRCAELQLLQCCAQRKLA